MSEHVAGGARATGSLRLALLRIAFELALVVGCASCFPAITCAPPPPCSRTATTVTQNFESDCTGPLCGFTVVSGASPRIVGAIHPAEHALQIPAGTTTELSVAGARVLRSSETIQLTARCDATASLVAIEEFVTDDGGSTTSTAAIATTADWAPASSSFGSSTGYAYVTPRALRLTVSGPAGTSCAVDELYYAIAANTCGYDADRADARDGSRDVQDVLRDAPSDRGDSNITNFGCTTDAQCGPSGRCLTQFPRGLCTRPCTRDSECGPTGVCDVSYCLPGCVPGAGDCDPFGGACTLLGTGTHACIWSCFPASASAPPGYPACDPMLACEPYTGACGGRVPGLAPNGDPCGSNADCDGGRCVTESDATGPTGWIGGYCISFARQAPVAAGEPVPQSNCPAGSGVVPFEGEGVGDLAPCFKLCDTSADCRAGYQCDHLADATGQFFSNGICRPIDCLAAGATCPAGYACSPSSPDASTPTGLCAATATDGGVPPDAGD